MSFCCPVAFLRPPPAHRAAAAPSPARDLARPPYGLPTGTYTVTQAGAERPSRHTAAERPVGPPPPVSGHVAAAHSNGPLHVLQNTFDAAALAGRNLGLSAANAGCRRACSSTCRAPPTVQRPFWPNRPPPRLRWEALVGTPL